MDDVDIVFKNKVEDIFLYANPRLVNSNILSIEIWSEDKPSRFKIPEYIFLSNNIKLGGFGIANNQS